MVLLTEKYSFLAASCCNVEVVNGGAGDFFAGFFSRSDTEKSALMFFSKKDLASDFDVNPLGSFALNICPFEVVKRASIL